MLNGSVQLVNVYIFDPIKLTDFKWVSFVPFIFNYALETTSNRNDTEQGQRRGPIKTAEDERDDGAHKTSVVSFLIGLFNIHQKKSFLLTFVLFVVLVSFSLLEICCL